MTVAILSPLLLLALPRLSAVLVDGDARVAELTRVATILTLQPWIDVATTYPRVVLQRNLDLTPLAASGIVGALLNTSLCIVALRQGAGPVGIAWASVAATLLSAPLIWGFMARDARGLSARPADPAPWKAVAQNALKLLPGGFTGYLNQKVDNLLVSSAVGPATMSFYSMSWNASRMSGGVLGQSMQSVLVPTLARIGEDPARVRRGLDEALRHAFLITCAASAVLFVVADDLVAVVLGAKWLPMVPALRIMCVTVLTTPMIAAAGAVLVGLGRAHLVPFATVTHLTVIAAVMIPLAARWGIVGAACGDLLGVALFTIVMSVMAGSSVRGLPLIGIRAAALPLMAASCAALAGSRAGGLVSGSGARLAIELVTVGSVYLIAIGGLGGRARLNDVGVLIARTLRPRAERVPAS